MNDFLKKFLLLTSVFSLSTMTSASDSVFRGPAETCTLNVDPQHSPSEMIVEVYPQLVSQEADDIEEQQQGVKKLAIRYQFPHPEWGSLKYVSIFEHNPEEENIHAGFLRFSGKISDASENKEASIYIANGRFSSLVVTEGESTYSYRGNCVINE